MPKLACAGNRAAGTPCAQAMLGLNYHPGILDVVTKLYLARQRALTRRGFGHGERLTTTSTS